uniref:Uncharacterized protein n=1 Tax=Arundo donax TaxID=35708 RepID=A0A0A9ADP6_ARUDO
MMAKSTIPSLINRKAGNKSKFDTRPTHIKFCKFAKNHI